MTADLRNLIESVLLVFAALLPIVNPFGGAPVFLAMTADCTPAVRAALAKRIAINAAVLLLASIFVGSYVLDFFGISVPVVQVAGGIVVCATGWTLLRQENALLQSPTPAPMAAEELATRAFYPLTLPLTVGPGTIAVAITLGANYPSSALRSIVMTALGQFIGAIAIAATVFVCFRYADRLLRRLGTAGTSVVVRLSAFILLCIGVQIVWNGASTLLASVAVAHPH